MFAVNASSTQMLVRVAKEFDVHSFIYTSSASVISNERLDLEAADETYSLVLGAQQPKYYVHTRVRLDIDLTSFATNILKGCSRAICALAESGGRSANISDLRYPTIWHDWRRKLCCSS